MAIELFNLVKEKMGVTVHLRIEKHGDENVNAYDVKLAGDFSNSVLLKLHPELRDTFYVADRQGDVEGFKKALRFPFMTSAIKWDQEVPRAKITLHDVHNDGESLTLQNGHADKFEFAMLEGGTVKLTCRVKLDKPTEDQITKLLRANGQTFPVSLACTPLEEEADNFQKVEQLSLTGTAPSAARLEAESMFDQKPTTMTLGEDTVASPAADTVTVADVHAGATTEEAAAKPTRVTKTKTPAPAPADAAPAEAAPRAKRTSRKAAEVE